MNAHRTLHDALERTTLQALLVARQLLALPFDIAREMYARAAHAGLIEKSLIASARFEHAVSSAEVLALGPWAR